MTTIITRLFASEEAAQRVANKLHWEGFPKRAYRVIPASAGSDAAAMEDRLKRAGVDPDAAAAYAGKLGDGGAVMVIHATYKPLGAARIAREILGRAETVDVGSVNDDFYVPDGPQRASSVLKDHPRIMTLPIGEEEIPRGPVTERFFPLLKAHKEGRSVMDSDRRMSRAFWPMPLVIRGRESHSVISGGKHMSTTFWPMALVSTSPRRKSVIPGGGLPLSRALGWPPISRRR